MHFVKQRNTIYVPSSTNASKKESQWTTSSQFSKRKSATGLTLNTEKFKFSKMKIKFLAQLVDKNEVKPDPDKIQVK